MPRRRTKSGCRTCRIRKVKCDETFPACRRCATTGRKCDGYGIRGGGHLVTITVPSPRVASTADHQAMEWFCHRTAVKLQGSFYSDFWTSLLTQSSVGEPAVLHAVLALSCVHRQGIVGKEGRGQSTAALQHYGQAIRCLQPHFVAGDRLARRVALIACVVFTSLDLLRGHFATAFTHLESGRKLLVWRGGGREYVDDWIEETFSRIDLQIGLMRFLHRGVFLTGLPFQKVKMATSFRSIKEAWVGLEHLLLGSMALSSGTTKDPQEYEHLQQSVVDWQTAYIASRQFFLSHAPIEVQKADSILASYHALASIMAAVSHSPNDEMIFDQHTAAFARLISRMLSVSAMSKRHTTPTTPPAFDMARSIIDMGCVIPLYYTALKCREHTLRQKAVIFLESTFHREGVWDAAMTARVARKVMELEGEGPVPARRRLQGVEVTIEGEPVRKVALFCRSDELTGGVRACVGEYDLEEGAWADGHPGHLGL
ncbi:C6 zinc finger domain protein [Plectosphaerella plurivora]|uniref:C6 zinc finger domain protein n=1 Tax=Plectosphaerella plurivora TaxID=936078 RepID=A0A9P8V783_9PEZI|nr:C6 zinc finger domain protein [Plectosphaerella plurivora]